MPANAHAKVKMVNKEKTFDIVHFYDVLPRDWDAFVDSCPEAWLYHKHFWIQTIETVYKKQKNLSFAIRDGSGNIVCITGLFLNCGKFGVKKLITGMAAGVAVSENIGKSMRKHLYRVLGAELSMIAKKESAVSIQMRLPNQAPAWIKTNSYIDSHLEKLGFTISLKYGITPYSSPAVVSLIPLLSDSEIQRGFLGGRKSNLAKSKLSGVRIIMPGDIPENQAIEAYYNISLSMQQRTGLPPFPKHVLSGILNNADFANKGGMYLLEKDDGNFLAGVLIIHYKMVATYYLGAFHIEGGGEKAATIVLWEAMRNERNKGANWFELGPYFPCLDHSDKMFLIGEFKRSFGGRKSLLLHGEKVFRPLSMLIREDLPAALRLFYLSKKKYIRLIFRNRLGFTS